MASQRTKVASADPPLTQTMINTYYRWSVPFSTNPNTMHTWGYVFRSVPDGKVYGASGFASKDEATDAARAKIEVLSTSE